MLVTSTSRRCLPRAWLRLGIVVCDHPLLPCTPASGTDVMITGIPCPGRPLRYPAGDIHRSVYKSIAADAVRVGLASALRKALQSAAWRTIDLRLEPVHACVCSATVAAALSACSRHCTLVLWRATLLCLRLKAGPHVYQQRTKTRRRQQRIPLRRHGWHRMLYSSCLVGRTFRYGHMHGEVWWHQYRYHQRDALEYAITTCWRGSWTQLKSMGRHCLWVA